MSIPKEKTILLKIKEIVESKPSSDIERVDVINEIKKLIDSYEDPGYIGGLREMKLYGIYSGCKFEGGGCGKYLYRYKDQARKAAIEVVNRKQREQDDLYKDEERPPVTKWTEDPERLNYWENGIDCVEVQEFEVLGEEETEEV